MYWCYVLLHEIRKTKLSINCLYITLFFNIVAGIVQTFIKSWNQLPCTYPRVIEICRQPFEPRHDFCLNLIIVVELFPSLLGFMSVVKKPMFHLQSQWSPETRLLPVRSAWETSARNPSVSFVWRNVPHIWRDFGSTLPFQTRLTQTKPVLPLSNEHSSQVKDQGRRQCCHNKHNNFRLVISVVSLVTSVVSANYCRCFG